MAIRDKVTVRLKAGKPFTYEVKRPGGKVDFIWHEYGVLQVQEQTRKGKVIRGAAFNGDDVKSVEFEPGG